MNWWISWTMAAATQIEAAGGRVQGTGGAVGDGMTGF